ncbi:DUF433 domain-containing protein [Magnetospirillum sp. 15-1]|uniref:DUF433 domain-containing protein n=1 Tax=Magnetospirillum sp. 15-1 TaxID=1979370 RepID=UPI0018D5908A|nr:DUF433 domain-containing protein [Magnetospirillum sp. 15-1]
MGAALLTPAEAAVIAGVSLRDINRVIDEKILPAGFTTVGDGRRIQLAACPLVGFYFRAAKALTAEERLLLILRFAERITGDMADHPFAGWSTADWTVHDGFLSVSLSGFVAEADDRSTRLAAARAMVVEDPAILSGTPVLRGTRIPLYDLVASVAAGLPRERIFAAYPGLNATALDLATLYAEANPVRGRPRRFTVLPPGATITAERTVPRRRRA